MIGELLKSCGYSSGSREGGIMRFGNLLNIMASAVCIVALMPLTFGMAGLAAPLFPLGNAVFFLAMMGGPILLLASGLRTTVGHFSKLQFLTTLTGLLAVFGGALFRWHGLFVDWMVMTIAVSVIAAILKQSWLWAVVGGAWAAVLLGVVSAVSLSTFFSSAARGVPKNAPLWLLACVLAFVSAILAFAQRREGQPSKLDNRA
jgi:hypothetical protein